MVGDSDGLWPVKIFGFSSIHASGKVKMHTLDIAPLRRESPPQKRSGMARVLEGPHSFTCTPTRSSAIGMSHIPAFALPATAGTHFPTPEGWKAE